MSVKEQPRASHHASPLRYPGGKGKLSNYVKAVIRQNRLLDRVYIEPFAGGGGVGLSLLLTGYVSRIVLNDLSKPIYAFWRAALDNTEEFKERILDVELSVEEWERQRAIFRSESASQFELGFAAFYLNRTNHSGVLSGGMIGGHSQKSAYGISARFNRSELAARIHRIGKNRRRIEVLNEDAEGLLSRVSEISRNVFLYVDPPYYKKGRDLYYNYYRADDHRRLRDAVARLGRDSPWIVSYDNVPEILGLYCNFSSATYNLSYSVRNGRVGREIMFFSEGLTIPPLESGGLMPLSEAA